MSNPKTQATNPELTPFEQLVKIMEILRSKSGCAWDRKQTHESLIPYLVEETYEVIEAINAQKDSALAEELGDLLVQIVFHAQLARERGAFDIDDSLKSIINKLIHRHPHVFEEAKDLEPQEVRDQWEKIKINSGEKISVLGGMPKSMPALVMAYRMGEKAAGVGFDWKNPTDVIEKLNEELLEIKDAASRNNKEHLEDEIGDILFATASLARKSGINPENALKGALEKFSSRFQRLEQKVRESGKNFEDFTLESLEEIWQEIK